MRNLKEKLTHWVEHRTGLESAVKNFLYEDIPASSGWHQVLGSVALFLFLLQAFTGVLLAFNYAATPGEAYNSLKYIITQLTGGNLIRGLHHWGASVVVVAAVLHMIRVIFFGSYKKPRELNWIIGILLLLVILAFGLTGYLLPWDQRAYWATVVTISIAKLTPFAGDFVAALMMGGAEVGALTLTRRRPIAGA